MPICVFYGESILKVTEHIVYMFMGCPSHDKLCFSTRQVT